MVLRRHAASRAYASLAKRVQQFPGPGFGLLDAAQLDALHQALDAEPGAWVGDLGCGLGLVAERLARDDAGHHAEAHLVGVDRAVGALDAAHRRGTGVGFATADLTALPFAADRFDGLVAVDSLYFLPDPDLDRAVAEAARVLAPGGRLVALASELLPAPGERPPEHTRLGRALRRAELDWTARDLTPLEHALWDRKAAALADLEREFDAEGHRDLWHELVGETERGVTWSRERRVRRYLFRGVRTAAPCAEALPEAALSPGDSR